MILISKFCKYPFVHTESVHCNRNFTILGVYSVDILHNLLNVVICKLASSMDVTNVKLVTYFTKYVTSQEFVLAKQTLKSDKTCGIDGLINEFFKSSQKVMILVLLKSMNKYQITCQVY